MNACGVTATAAVCMVALGSVADTVGRQSGMMQGYYLEKFRAAAKERAMRLDQVKTRADAEAYVRSARQRLAESFGPFPERTPLNARITGKLDTPELLIDKVIFESRPGLEVSSLFYRPRNVSGKIPGVLALCGHTSSGKMEYQILAESLALRGYGVLLIDPIGQGERHHSSDADQVEAGVPEHNMLGKQLSLTGEFFGAWRLWDAMRALDYLLSRPEIDPERVGVTGTSGGGTLSSYVNAFDPRLTMAAPSCYITTKLRNVENELPTDAEQNPPRFTELGCDMADLLIAAAPRPTRILAQDNDFFDPRGTREAFADAKKIYALLGAPDAIELFVGDGDHGYSTAHREAAGRFFNRISGLTSDGAEPELPYRFSEKEICCTPSGRTGGKGVFELMQEFECARRTPDGGVEALRELLRLGDVPLPDYRIWRPQTLQHEPQWILCRFGIETEPGIVVPLKQLSPRRLYQLKSTPEAVLFIPDMDTLSEFAELKLNQEGDADLFSLEMRGIGETKPAECDLWARDFFGCYGTDFHYASCADQLGQPYPGRRVHDVLATIRLLKAQGAESIHLIGNGQGAIIAAMAAAFAPEVRRVTLYHAPLSWRQMVNSPVVRWPFSSMVPGVLRKTDLPELYRSLSGKNLRLIDPWDVRMRDYSAEALSAALKEYGIDPQIVRQSKAGQGDGR